MPGGLVRHRWTEGTRDKPATRSLSQVVRIRTVLQLMRWSYNFKMLQIMSMICPRIPPPEGYPSTVLWEYQCSKKRGWDGRFWPELLGPWQQMPSPKSAMILDTWYSLHICVRCIAQIDTHPTPKTSENRRPKTLLQDMERVGGSNKQITWLDGASS